MKTPNKALSHLVRRWKSSKVCLRIGMLPVHPDNTSHRSFYWLRFEKTGPIIVSNQHTCSRLGARLLCSMARKQFLLSNHKCVPGYLSYTISLKERFRGNEARQIRARGLQIFADGSITIGCTSIPWSEICWLALKMGWWKTKPKRKKKLCQTKS